MWKLVSEALTKTSNNLRGAPKRTFPIEEIHLKFTRIPHRFRLWSGRASSINRICTSWSSKSFGPTMGTSHGLFLDLNQRCRLNWSRFYKASGRFTRRAGVWPYGIRRLHCNTCKNPVAGFVAGRKNLERANRPRIRQNFSRLLRRHRSSQIYLNSLLLPNLSRFQNHDSRLLGCKPTCLRSCCLPAHWTAVKIALHPNLHEIQGSTFESAHNSKIGITRRSFAYQSVNSRKWNFQVRTFICSSVFGFEYCTSVAKRP